MEYCSFDTKKGILNTDYKAYLSRHDIVYKSPVYENFNAATVGTGKIGLCTWNDNGIKMQLTNVDASPQTQISSGWVTIKTNLPTDNYSQRLCLYDGTLMTSYNDEFKLEFIGGCGDELLCIKVNDNRSVKSKTTICLSLWDNNDRIIHKSKYASYLKNPKDWNDKEEYIDDSTIAFSRGSNSDSSVIGVGFENDVSDESIYGYSLAVHIENAEYVTSKVNGELQAEIISDSDEYFIWILNPSRISAGSKDTLSYVKAMIDALPNSNEYKERCASFWHKFWETSFVMYHNEQNDYIENIYYVSKYLLACGMFGKNPYHFINGVWRNNADDNIIWSAAYWWYNQKTLYNSMYACGHFDMILPLINMYLSSVEMNKKDTKEKYSHAEGILVPETMGWDGNRLFCDSHFVEFLSSTGPEIALAIYRLYQYTRDEELLLKKFYPYAKEIAKFYLSYLLEKDDNGKYIVPQNRSSARECFIGVKDPVTDIAAVNALFPKIIEVSKILNTDEELCKKLEDVLSNLIDFHIGNEPTRYLPGDPAYKVKQNNVDDPMLEILYPFNLSGIGYKDRELLINNYEYRVGRCQTGHPISWDNSAIWAARLGLGDECYQNLRYFVSFTQKFISGMGKDGNCGFEYNGNLINAVNEACMQSYDGKIRIFPAMPKNESSFDAKFSLHAVGGFIVSSEYTQKIFPGVSTVRYIGVKSLYGNPICIINPWDEGINVIVMDCEKNNVILETTKREISFDTVKDGVYFIKKAEDEFSGESIQITAQMNLESKAMRYDEKVVSVGN